MPTRPSSPCSAAASSAGCSGWPASRSACGSGSSTRGRRAGGAVALWSSAPLDDERALAEVAEGADLVTYEWEGVPADAGRALAARPPVRPRARALEVAQDRLTEKETFRRLGIADARRSRPSTTAADLDRAVDALGSARGAEDAARRLRRQGPGGAARAGRRRRGVGRSSAVCR